jgi:type III restriction enzyme
MEMKIADIDFEENNLPTEIKEKMKSYGIKETFKEEAKCIELPQFYMKVQTSSVFEEKDTDLLLSKSMLLKGFDLSKEDHNIDFSISSSQMYQIDLEESNKDEYVPKYKQVQDRVKEQFVSYITTIPHDNQVNQIALMIKNLIRNIDEISDNHIVDYVKSALKGLNSEKLTDISNNLYYYASVVKSKIQGLMDNYGDKQFIKLLDKGEIFCINSFKFPKKISPKNIYHGITKSLYTEEGEINDFEKQVINKVANLDSVVFWHRNLERGHGFQLNGFINHYPDFIVKMKNGKIVLIETKGDHLDNSDSIRKIKLGEKWASKAGDNYRYFMVFDNAKLDGAKTVEELIDILKDMK